MHVTMFGLGEAGSLFAADLVSAGVSVAGYDPAPVTTPLGVERFSDPRAAVDGADVVLALTASADATTASMQALESIPSTALYADLSTSAADLKRGIGNVLADQGLQFVDVALMTIVVGKGLRTPALASGTGAHRYVELMRPLGVPVEVVSGRAGDAATRKLLRSVMMKGVAALVIEAMRAADSAGLSEWLWGNLVDEITSADGAWLARLVNGTEPHAVRRLHEMQACQSMLESLGVDPVMTRSTVASLWRVPELGVPVVPELMAPRRRDAVGVQAETPKSAQ